MTTPVDASSDFPDDGLSAEERRVASHEPVGVGEGATQQDFVGSGNNGGPSLPAAAGEPESTSMSIEDRVEPGDGGQRTSAHRPAGGIPEGADPAQRPLEGSSEEFPVAEGVRTDVELDEPVRRHGSSDAGSSGAAAGTVPAVAVEQTQTENPYPAETWKRPVTGVHRPSAPEGEVASE